MHFLLPFAAREQAVILLTKIDAGRLTIAKLAEHAVNTVDPHHIRHLIKECVGRFFNCFSDIQHTVARFFPVTVMSLRAGERPGGGAEETGLRRDHAVQ